MYCRQILWPMELNRGSFGSFTAALITRKQESWQAKDMIMMAMCEQHVIDLSGRYFQSLHAHSCVEANVDKNAVVHDEACCFFSVSKSRPSNADKTHF